MTDKMTPEQRHRCMSRIRGKDTRPELIVRRWLWHEGWRYRLHVKHLPGTPDIVIHRLRTAIFVNGCFWHGHHLAFEMGMDGELSITDSDCCRLPASNTRFWRDKILRNIRRDSANYALYRHFGWHALIVWECMLRPKMRESTLLALSHRLNDIFLAQVRKPKPYSLPEEESEDYIRAAEE